MYRPDICDAGIVCVYKDKCKDGCRESKGPVIAELWKWYRANDFEDFDQMQGAFMAIKQAENIISSLGIAANTPPNDSAMQRLYLRL